MKKLILLAFCFGIAIVLNAQVDTSLAEPSDSTAIGAPDGKLISKEIGSAGGTIISEDGKVELIFPEGALDASTAISIQPIINLAPNGSGKAYQFEPSGIQFKKPVKIIFHYTKDEVEICPVELMGLAMQDQTGKWDFFDYDDFDSIASVVQGTISHFSIYAKLNKVQLKADKDYLRVKEYTEINIVDISRKWKKGSLAGQYIPVNISKRDDVFWYVNNVKEGNHFIGLIEAYDLPLDKTKVHYAKFTAPNALPFPNPAVITADVHIQFKRKNKNELLQREFKCKITIYEKYKMVVTWDADDATVKSNKGLRYIDSASCLLIVDTKVTMENVENIMCKVVLRNTKCTVKYVNEATCIGPVNISGMKSSRVGNGTYPYASVNIIFQQAPMTLPILQVTGCGPGNPVTPLFYGLGAFPNLINFETKDEVQRVKLFAGVELGNSTKREYYDLAGFESMVRVIVRPVRDY